MGLAPHRVDFDQIHIISSGATCKPTIIAHEFLTSTASIYSTFGNTAILLTEKLKLNEEQVFDCHVY